MVSVRKLLFICLGLGFYYSASCMKPINNYEELIQVCKDSKFELIKEYLKDPKIDLNAKDQIYGYTPLMWACIYNNKQLVQFLIEAKAHPNIEDNKKCTPLRKVCDKKFFDLIPYLIEGNADPNHQNRSGFTIFMNIVNDRSENIMDVIKLLIKTSDLNVQNNFNNRTALIDTCTSSLPYKYKIIELLLEKKASPLVQDKQQNTALHYLCQRGDLAGTKIFVKKVQDHLMKTLINVENEDGETPYTIALSTNTEILKFLRSLKKDDDMEDKKNNMEDMEDEELREEQIKVIELSASQCRKLCFCLLL